MPSVVNNVCVKFGTEIIPPNTQAINIYITEDNVQPSSSISLSELVEVQLKGCESPTNSLSHLSELTEGQLKDCETQTDPRVFEFLCQVENYNLRKENKALQAENRNLNYMLDEANAVK
ncbi:uncharacterized protein [Eurosta solidaginis]|uniref:uncharacterized protein n=1 Tax=Eurosta solidaginis TaxID=178769 RepID=UPI0035305F00